MAPFRALRYAPEVVQDLSHVLAPPYDVISADEQARLYEASPFNVVRLIYGQQFPADTPTDNRYSRARESFEQWRRQQVLRRDATPSFSLIEHSFSWNGATASRLGFLGLLRLEEGVPTSVFRHEATLEQPKADRRRLLEAVPANLSPIFCVYPDEAGTLQAFLEQWRRRTEPTATATVGAERIRVWAVTEAEPIRLIQQRLAAVSVLIADGHHRYEVAFANRARYGAVMAYFVSMQDPALQVRPIHRLVQASPPHGLAPLGKRCAIQPARDLTALMQWMRERVPGRFGCAWRGALYHVEMEAEALASWRRQPPVPPEMADLDVSLLHRLVLPALGIEDRHVTYCADAARALASVEAQEAAMAWFLREIPIDRVYSIASRGLTLPPKSTFFYPKVLSGLALNPFE